MKRDRGRIVTIVFLALAILVLLYLGVTLAKRRDQSHPAPQAAGLPRISLGVTVQERQDGTVLVSAVSPGGPADKAGLRPGDVFRTVGGESAKTLDDLAGLIRKASPGVELHIVVEREDREAEFSLVPEERTR